MLADKPCKHGLCLEATQYSRKSFEFNWTVFEFSFVTSTFVTVRKVYNVSKFIMFIIEVLSYKKRK